MTSQAGSRFLENMFKLKEHGSNVRTIIAGITTFMTMAYIIIVNPIILEGAGMDFRAGLTACLAAGLTTILMAIYARYPCPGAGDGAMPFSRWWRPA